MSYGSDENVFSYTNNKEIDDKIRILEENVTSQLAENATLTDGTLNDTQAVQKLTTSINPLLSSKVYNVTSQITFNNATKLKGNKGNSIKNTANASNYSINSSDVHLEGVVFDSLTNAYNTIVVSPNVDKLKIKDSEILSGGNAFYMSNPNITNVSIKDNKINAKVYGILVDSGCTSGENLSIINNDIYSDHSDGIEINLPSTTPDNVFKSVRIIGNKIKADINGGTSTAGFAIGVANAKNTVITDNTITRSRNEAIHIEDAQEGLVVANNTAKECYGDGFKFYKTIAGRTGKPAVIEGNYFIKEQSLIRQGKGIYTEMPNAILSNNVIKDFQTGMFFAQEGSFPCNNNTIINSTVAIEVVKNASVIGTTFVENCDTLVQAGRNSEIGKIVSATTPTRIMRYYDPNNLYGATLKGFKFPLAGITTTAGSNPLIDMFDLPDLINGRLIFKMYGLVDQTQTVLGYLSSDVVYNGGTLTLSNTVKRVYGSFDFNASTPILVNGTKLSVKTYSPNAITIRGFEVDFNGDYYIQTYSA